MEENLLVEGLRRGESNSLEHLFNIYKDKVFNTAISYVQNAEDAEELTQDVFFEAFRSIEKYKGDSSLSTWIYRITVNKSLDFIRYTKRKKRFAVITNLFNPQTGEQKFDATDFVHPGTELEKKEQSAHLFKALEKLPENQKTAFILSKIEGLSYVEISKVMKLSVSSVESLLFRAKQNLKKNLSRYYDDL
ncbi:MAG: RNA polymerase sigma factor [Ignavibacteria bacterium]|nr:RNA polymerase sigma factor [Ignavibacteria bacterium]